MVADSRIPLSGVAIDTATPIRQQQQQENQNMLATQQALGQYYDNLSSREKSRLQSTISGAVQLKTFLDNNDVQGAENFLTQRRQNLQAQLAEGNPVDTQDTDAALQMLREGRIDELNNNLNGLIAAGRVYGVTTQPSAGATGALMDRLKNAYAARGIKLDDGQLLELIKGGAGQRGRLQADIDLGNQANYTTRAGTQQANLDFEPQITRENAVAQQTGTRLGENINAYTDFVAAEPQLENVLNRLYLVTDKSTYTGAGRVEDFIQREFGFDPGDDAAARAYSLNLIRNEVLPLLKPTFGAAFTVREGEWLLNTFGDPNLSPREKRAALQARADSWRNMAATMATRAQMEPIDQPFSNFPPQGQTVTVVNPQTNEAFTINVQDLQAAEAEGFVRQ